MEFRFFVISLQVLQVFSLSIDNKLQSRGKGSHDADKSLSSESGSHEKEIVSSYEVKQPVITNALEPSEFPSGSLHSVDSKMKMEKGISDVCAKNPCKNGGVCRIIQGQLWNPLNESYSYYGGYTCLCTAKFTGYDCAYAKSYCSPNPCINGGICETVKRVMRRASDILYAKLELQHEFEGMPTGYQCLCNMGFNGQNCELPMSTLAEEYSQKSNPSMDNESSSTLSSVVPNRIDTVDKEADASTTLFDAFSTSAEKYDIDKSGQKYAFSGISRKASIPANTMQSQSASFLPNFNFAFSNSEFPISPDSLSSSASKFRTSIAMVHSPVVSSTERSIKALQASGHATGTSKSEVMPNTAQIISLLSLNTSDEATNLSENVSTANYIPDREYASTDSIDSNPYSVVPKSESHQKATVSVREVSDGVPANVFEVTTTNVIASSLVFAPTIQSVRQSEKLATAWTVEPYSSTLTSGSHRRAIKSEVTTKTEGRMLTNFGTIPADIVSPTSKGYISLALKSTGTVENKVTEEATTKSRVKFPVEISNYEYSAIEHKVADEAASSTVQYFSKPVLVANKAATDIVMSEAPVVIESLFESSSSLTKSTEGSTVHLMDAKDKLAISSTPPQAATTFGDEADLDYEKMLDELDNAFHDTVLKPITDIPVDYTSGSDSDHPIKFTEGSTVHLMDASDDKTTKSMSSQGAAISGDEGDLDYEKLLEKLDVEFKYTAAKQAELDTPGTMPKYMTELYTDYTSVGSHRTARNLPLSSNSFIRKHYAIDKLSSNAESVIEKPISGISMMASVHFTTRSNSDSELFISEKAKQFSTARPTVTPYSIIDDDDDARISFSPRSDNRRISNTSFDEKLQSGVTPETSSFTPDVTTFDAKIDTSTIMAKNAKKSPVGELLSFPVEYFDEMIRFPVSVPFNETGECMYLGSSWDLYDGAMNHAIDGSPCLPWNVSNEQAVPFDGANHSYCRNPTRYPFGPWCYIMDPGNKVTKARCIRTCNRKMHKCVSFNDYLPAFNESYTRTSSGRRCQNWDRQTPHSHQFVSLASSANYCRNPDHSAGGPWCFTTDPAVSREYCVPLCHYFDKK